jgi:hypothetical protein
MAKANPNETHSQPAVGLNTRSNEKAGTTPTPNHNQALATERGVKICTGLTPRAGTGGQLKS